MSSLPGDRILSTTLRHVARGDELPLLHVHRPAAPRARERAGRSAGTGTPAPGARRAPRRRARPRRRRARRRAPARPVSSLTFREDAEPLDEAGPAIGVDRGPVGLVVGRLVDERHARVARSIALQALGDHQRVRLVLDGAGAADQGERRAAADGDAADADRAWSRLTRARLVVERRLDERRRTAGAAPTAASGTRDGTGRPRTTDDRAAR